MITDRPQLESPFSESEEEEFASEMLAASSDHELNRLLSVLLRRAVSASGGGLGSQLGRILGGLAKGAIRQVLPTVGRGPAPLFGSDDEGLPGLLGVGASRLLGLESEGLSAEDQEFNAARQLVRFLGAAIADASSDKSGNEADRIGRQAMASAARLHAPGLVRVDSADSGTRPATAGCGCGCGGSRGCGGGAGTRDARAGGPPRRTGVWERHGHDIVLRGF